MTIDNEDTTIKIKDKTKLKMLFLGVGSPLSKCYYNTSILLNNKILLDAPPGIDKKLNDHNISLENIDFIFISHLHGDHFLGLPQLLLNIRMINRQKPLFIVGPELLQSKLYTILKLTFNGQEDNIINESKSKFIVVSNDNINDKIDNLNYSSYQLSHGSEINYGYVIDINGINIGYTGDTGKCPNLDKLVNRSDHIIIDMTFEQTTSTHLGMDFIKKIVNNFQNKSFYAIHRGKELDQISCKIEGLNVPHDGNLVEF